MNANSEHQNNSEFMLKEYELLYNLAINESDRVEQRVSHFLTILSAALGALLVLSQISNLDLTLFYTITQGILLILLFYGITIQNRLIARGVQHYAYTDFLLEIQKYFSSSEPSIAHYFSVQKKLFEQKTNDNRGIIYRVLGRMRGTLQEFIILSNAFICGTLVLVSMIKGGYSSSLITVATIITFFISAIILISYYYLMLKIVEPFKLTLLD